MLAIFIDLLTFVPTNNNSIINYYKDNTIPINTHQTHSLWKLTKYFETLAGLHTNYTYNVSKNLTH